MKTLFPYKIDRRRNPSGVALVIVVSLIAMLTVVTVALMIIIEHSTQRAASEVAVRQTESLAETAFQTLLADLADEMEKGSANVVENEMEDGRTHRLYDLTGKRPAMRVSSSLREGASTAGVLVKQSQPDKPFHVWTGARESRASGVSSAEGNAPFAPEAWDRVRLLAVEEAFTKTSAPTWVHIARDGSSPKDFSRELAEDRGQGSEPNSGFVVGRYAYNLYDTSGLIDLNVAGFPSTEGPSKERVGEKGSLMFADLTRLPGMTQSGVDDLANWRHQWKSQPIEYVRLSEGSGWRRMAANDNLFLSRQDLLAFADENPEVLPREALPYFTHFSRDLDAPSHRPDPTRPKIVRNAAAGGNDAYRADEVVNPDLAAFNETRGRPLMERRFPLERLKWVVTPGENGPLDVERAERYFGLRWQGSYWEYVHGRPNGDLFTLQDVPKDREPNFFEILRATVVVGSLGRQYGARGHDDLDQQYSMHKLGGVDGSVNLNIMEMGACLIDQYDGDSYPTAILLPGPARPYYVYGKEDVPYLNRLSAIPYRGKVLSGAPVYYEPSSGGEAGPIAPSETYEVSMVLQPMLWRPHQPAKVHDGPVHFRIRPQHVDLGGGSQFWMVNGWPVPGKGPKPGQPSRGTAGDYSYWGAPNYRVTDPELFPKTFAGDEYVDVTVAADSLAFREPQSVHSPEHGAIAGYSVSGNVEPIEVRDADLRWEGLPTSYKSVSGFLVGRAISARLEAAAPPAGMNAPSSWGRLGVGYFRGDPLEVQMEYKAADGSWRPYQRAEFTFKSNWGDHYLRREPLWQTEAFHWSSYLIDPRTARFGGQATVLAGGVSVSSWTSLHPQMQWPEGSSLTFGKLKAQGVRPGWTGPAMNTGWSYNGNIGWSEPFNPGGVVDNDQAAWDDPLTFAYKDPDDVLRTGVAAVNEYSRSMFLGNPMVRRYQISKTGALSRGDPVFGRPVILNRPFRSVGELAYSFRGTPWRDIDFLNANSPDAGLLDVFCLYEDPDEEVRPLTDPVPVTPRVVAGRVNLNVASLEVMTALISGAGRDEGNQVSASEASTLGRAIIGSLRSGASTGGLMVSRSELVSRPTGSGGKASGMIQLMSDKYVKPEDRSINDRREAMVRALSDGTTVRSWNFMLDLVVQGGRLPPGSEGFEDFQANAERRYWVHFAVDRLTGQLLDVQWERVEF